MLSMKPGRTEVELLPLSQRQVLTKRIKRTTQMLHKVHFPSACPWNNSTVLPLCPPGSPPGREHHSHPLYPADKSLLTATLYPEETSAQPQQDPHTGCSSYEIRNNSLGTRGMVATRKGGSSRVKKNRQLFLIFNNTKKN